MDTGFIDALLKNFKRCEGRKEDDKNSIDRCCGCSISGIWICPLVLYQSGGRCVILGLETERGRVMVREIVHDPMFLGLR